MKLAEIRQLDFKEVGNWPAAPKLGALVILLIVLIFLGYWVMWKDKIAEIDSAREKESGLKETFLSKKKQAINLDAYRKQLSEVEQSFGSLLKQLPSKSEMDALLTDVNQAGLGRGLQFQLFKPAPQETMHEFYAELPISIKLTGNYHDIGAFASDISQLSRIVTLNDLDLSVSPKDSSLTMDAVAKTFRYLDDEEIAKNKRAADKAKDKNK